MGFANAYDSMMLKIINPKDVSDLARPFCANRHDSTHQALTLSFDCFVPAYFSKHKLTFNLAVFKSVVDKKMLYNS